MCVCLKEIVLLCAGAQEKETSLVQNENELQMMRFELFAITEKKGLHVMCLSLRL